MAGGSFLAILRISGFLSAVWSVGKLAKFIGVSSIVFEIALGLVLSPSMLGLLPPPYSECYAKRDMYPDPVNRDQCSTDAIKESIWDPDHHLTHMMEHMVELSEGKSKKYGCKEERIQFLTAATGMEKYAAEKLPEFMTSVDCIKADCGKEVAHMCGVEPNIFTLIGHTGVSMMIFESGMHFDFEKAKVVGGPACVVAVLGTCLPLIAGLGLSVLYGFDAYPDGLAAGVSLAPTSVGIALKLLLEAKQLQKDYGQAIITAAFVDDILSLVAFNILFAVTEGDIGVMTFVPSIIGIVFLIIGAGLGIKFWPYVVEEYLSKVPSKKGAASISRQDEALLFLMFSLLLSYATFTFYLGSHLWGCFVAGMSFAMIHHAHHVYSRQVKRLTVWMLRVFFSCTVAFAIPWEDLLTFDAFWKGSVMGVFACIGTKVVCAFFMGGSRFVIGWAMVGRAEFAYLIAEMAKSGKVMKPELFAIVIWSLLYATIFAPFCFRKVLARYAATLENEESNVKKQGSLGLHHSSHDTAKHGAGHTTVDGCQWTQTELSAYRFQIVHPKSAPTCNVEDLEEMGKLLSKNGFSVTEVSQRCDLNTHFSTFQIEAGDGKKLEDSELNFLQEEIFAELKGTGAHIVFLPPCHSLRSKCKLAKVTVVADMTSELVPGVDAISSIIDAVVIKSFYVMRASVEIHGKTAIFCFIVGHLKALEFSLDPGSAAGPRRSLRAQAFGIGTGEAPLLLSKAELSMDHLHIGTSELPDIMPEELVWLKKRIEAAVDTRARTVVEPMTYTQGPTGEFSHDSKMLMQAQDEVPTCEIRFTLNRVRKALFSKILRCIAGFGMSVVSARLDERAACQINIVVSSPELSAEFEDKLMNELAVLVDGENCKGHVDLANLNAPLEKQYRDIGVESPRSANGDTKTWPELDTTADAEGEFTA